MIINKLNELMPKIKIKLSTERSFDQQWRDYLLNPTLESPLKQEINNQITDLILSSIVDQNHKLEDLIIALEELKEETRLIQQPIVENDDPNSTGSITTTMTGDILYYEYTMSLMLVILNELSKQIDQQITTLSGMDQELGAQIDILDTLMQSHLAIIITEFSEDCEGIILGHHQPFRDLLHAFSFDEMEHHVFHGELGRLIAKLHREEHGVEPHEGIIHSIRERVIHRAHEVRQLGVERNQLIAKKEVVCKNLEECRMLKKEVSGLKHHAKTGRPGDEVALAKSVETINQRFHPIPKFSSRIKDENEKDETQRFQKRV